MCGLFLCEIIKGFHHYARILIFLSCFGIYSDSATFSRNFSGFRAGFGSCFGDFCSFSYFSRNFFGFRAEFGVLL